RRQVSATDDGGSPGSYVPPKPTTEERREMKTTTETPEQPADRFRFTDVLIACAGVLLLCALAAAVASAKVAPQTSPGDAIDPRTYEPTSKPFLELHATGVQKYTCQANGTWLFTDPEATLSKTSGTAKAVGTHFLNFATGRPVWRFEDGSSGEAAREASAPPGAGDIAGLPLQTAGTMAGGGGGRPAQAAGGPRPKPAAG